MVAEFAADAPHLFALLGSPMPSWAAVHGRVGGLAGQGHGLGSPTPARLLLASPRDFLDRHFESAKVKATMAAWGMHLDFPPDAAGGALFPYLESMANQSFGMVIGQGGADTIVKAMTGYLEGEGRRDPARRARRGASARARGPRAACGSPTAAARRPAGP